MKADDDGKGKKILDKLNKEITNSIIPGERKKMQNN